MKKGITLKVFFITSLLLAVTALIIYLTLYFLLPTYYYSYKKTTLTEGVEQLVFTIEKTPIEEVEVRLNQFAESYNIRLVIQNHLGYVIYFPMDQFVQEELAKRRIPFPGRENLNQRILVDSWNNSDVIMVSSPILFQGDHNQYVLTVSAPLQPIDEASKVIIKFLPYMLVVIAIISVMAAYIYSNILSKPLIELNKTAKKMARLDFSTKPKINSNDELGELSVSLNKLSTNLQRNMNELKKANAQLKDDIQKERDQESKRREFIATISHELKTPITAVSGQLEGMIYGIGPFKDRDKYLKQSYSILNEMEKLVHEILDVSQLESFDFTPQIQTVNLSQLIRKCVDRFTFFYNEKEIKVEIELEKDVVITGDERLLLKAISNIISNAVKYTPNKETIVVSLCKDAAEIQFKVFNSGVQIKDEHLEKIFDPFYRIEKSRNRKTGGSGLGLYIVKRIVEMHNLAYSIQNVENGIVFTIIFISEGENIVD